MKPKIDFSAFEINPSVPLRYTDQSDFQSPIVNDYTSTQEPQYDDSFWKQFEVTDEQIETSPSQLESGIRGLGQGASFGFEDEIRGAILGSYDALTSEMGYGDAYTQRRDEIRELNREAREANPGTYLTGELTGGIATGIAAAPLTGGASLGGTALNAGRVATTLGTQGAVAGLGYSEAEDLSGMARDTAIGGTIGATLGTGGAYASRALVNRAKGFTNRLSESSRNLISKLPAGVGSIRVGDMLRKRAERNAAKVLGAYQLRDLPEDEINMIGRVAIDRGVFRNPTTENIRQNIVRQNKIFNKELTDPNSKFGEIAEYGSYNFGKNGTSPPLTPQERDALRAMGKTDKEIDSTPYLQNMPYYSPGRIILRKQAFPEESVEREGLEKLFEIIDNEILKKLPSRIVNGKRVYNYEVNGRTIANRMADVAEEANFGNANPTRNELAARYAYTELGNILNDSISSAQFNVRRMLSETLEQTASRRTGSDITETYYQNTLENVNDVKDALNLHLQQLEELTGNVNLARTVGSIEAGTSKLVPQVEEGTLTQIGSQATTGALGYIGAGAVTDDPNVQLAVGALTGLPAIKATPFVSRNLNRVTTRASTEGLDRVGAALQNRTPSYDRIAEAVRSNPQSLGQFGTMLRNAMDKGSHNYAVAYQALFNNNSEFREMVRNQESEE